MRVQKRYIILIIVIALVGVLIWKLYPSFAYMEQGYEGNNIITGRNWGVNITEISNLQITGEATLEGNTIAKDRISTIATTLNFYAVLKEPGDQITFDVKVTNTGKLNAELYAIANAGLSNLYGEEVDYIVVPLDYVTTHTEEQSGSIIKAGESQMFRVTLKYRTEVAKSVDKEFSLSMGTTFIYKQR